MIDIEVTITNVYEDPLDQSPDAMVAKFERTEEVQSVKIEVDENRPHIACTTLELAVPDIPPEFADEDEWDRWAEEMILPFTGIGNPEGDAGYFAEITTAPEEYEYAWGKTFEWGI